MIEITDPHNIKLLLNSPDLGKSDIQKAGVQYIITSTVEALKANPDRR